jgi:hypothetical protein
MQYSIKRYISSGSRIKEDNERLARDIQWRKLQKKPEPTKKL